MVQLVSNDWLRPILESLFAHAMLGLASVVTYRSTVRGLKIKEYRIIVSAGSHVGELRVQGRYSIKDAP